MKLSTASQLALWRDERNESDHSESQMPSVPTKGFQAKSATILPCSVERSQTASVFKKWPQKPSKMIRMDLEAASSEWILQARNPSERKKRESTCFLSYRDDAGCVADFHSLRHTFISNLARGGVHPKIAQALARHSTITLTMDRYSNTNRGQLADALSALPDLTCESRLQRQVAVDTGTYGNSLPKNLPKPVASAPTRVASIRTRKENSTAVPDSRNNENHAVSCIDSHSLASRSATPLSLRRAGFEPATFGSVDRCSIQLS